jgi:rhodanese-related sulfurtransferase
MYPSQELINRTQQNFKQTKEQLLQLQAQQQSKSIMEMADNLRRKAFGVCTIDEVLTYAKDPSAVWLDARGEDEITTTGQFVFTDKKWMHTSCSTFDCPLLKMAAENMIKDKEAKIIVYCSDGRRAMRARKILLEKGYTHVLNAGGDLDGRAQG